MLDCVGKVETTSGRPNKPIVISANRFQDICYRANQVDKKKQAEILEEERSFREYLKRGNELLVAKFSGNIQRTQEQKLKDLKEQSEQKHLLLQANREQSKLTEAKKRRERIIKAQLLIERLKPGPRELRSAAIQSEVLQARNMQLAANAEYQKAIKAQKSSEMKTYGDQANAFVQERQERAIGQQQQTNAYKQELLQVINESSKQRNEYKKKLIAEQQALREASDREIQEQIAKEKKLMEKKREMLRKNALEAMKMAEQRRLRDRMVDEVEDVKNSLYNGGKRQLDDMRDLVDKKIAADRAKKIEDNTQLWVAAKPDCDGDTDKRVQRDISRMQLVFTDEEREKIRRAKAAKQARIEAHLREEAQKKEAKKRAEAEKRSEKAQRFKNTEVNGLFNEAQKHENTRKAEDYRSHLNRQVEEKKRLAKINKEMELAEVGTGTDPEDKFFFQYARDLMEDARKKNRPLGPFTRVINQYKREHNIDCDRKIPRHLVSNVKLGPNDPQPLPPCNEPSTSGSGSEIKFVFPKAFRHNYPNGISRCYAPGGPRSPRYSNENIREPRSIYIREGFKQGKPSSFRSKAIQQNEVEPETLSNCVHIENLSKMAKYIHAKPFTPRRLIACKESRLDNKEEEAAAAAAAVGEDCVASKPSSTKIRYSLAELKKLNKYA